MSNTTVFNSAEAFWFVSSSWATLDARPYRSIAADIEVCQGIQFVTWLHYYHILQTLPQMKLCPHFPSSFCSLYLLFLSLNLPLLVFFS